MSSLVSSLHVYFSLHIKETNYLPCERAANQALSATPVLIAAALYKIGDRVKAIPDTARGVHPKHLVAFHGIVAEVLVEKTENCWMYKIVSDQHARSHLTVPEARVRPMPISLSDDAVIATRAFTLLERFVAEKQKSAGHMRQTFIHFPRFFSEKQYFSRFSTQYSIESTISRGRFFPALPLLSLGSRFLSC